MSSEYDFSIERRFRLCLLLRTAIWSSLEKKIGKPSNLLERKSKFLQFSVVTGYRIVPN